MAKKRGGKKKAKATPKLTGAAARRSNARYRARMEREALAEIDYTPGVDGPK